MQTPLLTARLVKMKKVNPESSHSLASKMHKLLNKSEKVIITPILELPKYKLTLQNLEINLKEMIKILVQSKRIWTPSK